MTFINGVQNDSLTSICLVYIPDKYKEERSLQRWVYNTCIMCVGQVTMEVQAPDHSRR